MPIPLIIAGVAVGAGMIGSSMISANATADAAQQSSEDVTKIMGQSQQDLDKMLEVSNNFASGLMNYSGQLGSYSTGGNGSQPLFGPSQPGGQQQGGTQPLGLAPSTNNGPQAVFV
jgi:hypothetical protein